MEKVTQLFIRACKSSNSKPKLLRLYKKFYFVEGVPIDTAKENIISILSEISSEYCKTLSPYTVYAELAHDKYLLVDDERNLQDKMLDFLVNHIAFTRSEKFEGLTAPCKFREKETLCQK